MAKSVQIRVDRNLEAKIRELQNILQQKFKRRITFTDASRLYASRQGVSILVLDSKRNPFIRRKK